MIATALPLLVVASTLGGSEGNGQIHLMELYAIGVVGAITVNLGSCIFNKKLGLHWNERAVMIFTALILLAVELTLAKTKPNALFFIICILLSGFALRAVAQRGVVAASGELAATDENPATPAPPLPRPQQTQVQAIMVAARGWTPVLHFALEEARLRGAILYVLYVRLISVSMLTAQQGRIRELKENIQTLSQAPVTESMQPRERAVAAVDSSAEMEQEINRLKELAAQLKAEIGQLQHLQTENSKLRAQVAAPPELGLTAEEAESLAKAKERAQSIACVNNLKQFGLAVRIWALDNNDSNPPNVLSMVRRCEATLTLRPRSLQVRKSSPESRVRY